MKVHVTFLNHTLVRNVLSSLYILCLEMLMNRQHSMLLAAEFITNANFVVISQAPFLHGRQTNKLVR